MLLFVMKSKRGAIEMSIGTIVIIVLSMSMLILGMILVKNIFSGATNIVDLNNEQISSEIAKLYGDDKELVIYPSVDIFNVNAGERAAFAIRIKNLLGGASASDAVFSYDIVPDDFRDCGLNENQILSWMKSESGEGIRIPVGKENIEKILIEIPEGSPLCSFKIRVTVLQNNQPYAVDQMFIDIKG
jgi:hypothetical protein